VARRKQKNSDNPLVWILGIIVALGILMFVLKNILIIAPIVIVLVAVYFWNRNRKHKQRIQEEENRRQQEIQVQLNYERKLLQSGIREIDVMKGEDFEEFLAVLFRNLGLQVETTPKSKDFGADLILTNKDGKRVAVQAKRYERTVGVDAIQQVIGAKGHYNTQDAWVITNQDFSDGAKDLAKSNNVRLYNREALIEIVVKSKQAQESERLQTV
jgi:restriction system protein